MKMRLNDSSRYDTTTVRVLVCSSGLLEGLVSVRQQPNSPRRSLPIHGPRAIRDLSRIQITDDDQIAVAKRKVLENQVRRSVGKDWGMFYVVGKS